MPSIFSTGFVSRMDAYDRLTGASTALAEPLGVLIGAVEIVRRLVEFELPLRGCSGSLIE